MTVSELIAQLQKLPKDIEVIIDSEGVFEGIIDLTMLHRDESDKINPLDKWFGDFAVINYDD